MTTDHAGPPSPGRLKLVVLIDEMQFHSIIPGDAIEGLVSSMEDRIKGGQDARHDMPTQMSLRSWVATVLRERETAKASFDDVAGAACLWLTMNHYREGGRMREAVRSTIGAGTTLTVSIADSPEAASGTAWSFMVGDRIHDGRGHLAGHAPGQISVYGPDETASWRDANPAR